MLELMRCVYLEPSQSGSHKASPLTHTKLILEKTQLKNNINGCRSCSHSVTWGSLGHENTS